jgi:magnesium-transporting ATPase (P-type)
VDGPGDYLRPDGRRQYRTLLLFSTMFVKMLFKNVRRIRRIEVDKRRLWHMMPVKSYAIMAFMITFGILLRNCPAIPSAFIASFYVGLGSALMVAGTVYISALLCPKEL